MTDISLVETVTIDAEAVKEYLIDHPDFLEQHRDLLTYMAIPHDAGAVSLVERQVQALRDKNRELQAQMMDMMWHASENEHLLAKVVQLTAEAVLATSLQQLAEILRHQLHQHFHTDAEALLICGSGDALPPLRFVDHREMLYATSCGFPDAAPVCGTLDKASKSFLFGDFPNELRSVALLPLGQLAKNGVLAIASRDDQRYSPKMGTTFLELLAQFVNSMVEKLRTE